MYRLFVFVFLLLLNPQCIDAQTFLQNMGSNINSRYSEICPQVSPDGQTLYFSRGVANDRMNMNRQIMISHRQNSGSWSRATQVPGVINNNGWNTVCGITTDGNTLLLGGIYMPDGTLKGGFSKSKRLPNGEWGTPYPLKIEGISRAFETLTATMSGDGRVIIFSSNIPFGEEFYGIYDLYVIFEKEDGSWTYPMNLGQTINTRDYETAPFLASDGISLYFSTNKSDGYGGTDIYVCRRLDNSWTNWSAPTNLGPAVNTAGWESYISVTASGDYAYVGSTRGGFGKMDIFRVRLRQELKPKQDEPIVLEGDGIVPSAALKPNKTTVKQDANYTLYEGDPEARVKPENKTPEKPNVVLKDRNETQKTIAEKPNNTNIPKVKTPKGDIKPDFKPEKEASELATESTQPQARNQTAENRKVTENTQVYIPKTYTPTEMPVLPTPEKVEDISYSAARMQNLGGAVNTWLSEMAPLISPDGMSLFFSRSLASDRKNVNRNIHCAKIDQSGRISAAQVLPGVVNNDGWNIACGITPDGNTLLLTGRYKADGTLAGGFSKAHRTAEGWTNPEPLDIRGFPEKEDTQAGTMSPDGRIIIFPSSSKYGGEFYGVKDLYVTFEQPDGTWSQPMNLGKSINTAGYETSPFLAADGVSLYFSSDGHPGYGSHDIFVSKRLDNSWQNWSAPRNLGPEVNSSAWEAYFSIAASGEYAYVGSLNESLAGGMDLFRIPLKNAPKPLPVVILKGHVIDNQTKEPLAAQISYQLLSDTAYQGTARTNPVTGEYKIVLNAGGNYAVHAQASGYYGINENFDLTGLQQYEEHTRDLRLSSMAVGAVIPMQNVFFELASAVLKRKSYPELDRLVKMLNENPNIKIEVAGHSDIGHSDPRLSQNRADAVKGYLVYKGIAKERIRAVGYADTRPLYKKSSAGAYKNRRVEVIILDPDETIE